MLKLERVTKVKMLFLVVVFVLKFDLFKISAAILEKGLLIHSWCMSSKNVFFLSSYTMNELSDRDVFIS